MDDQDLINLQKLLGRAPQPSLLDPPTPDHLLYAQALWDHSGPFPIPERTPEQIALTNAVGDYIRQAAQSSGDVSYLVDASDAVDHPPGDPIAGYSDGFGQSNQQLLGYSYPAPRRGLPGSASPAANVQTRVAMGLPGDVDLPLKQIADQYSPGPLGTTSGPTSASLSASTVQTAIDTIPDHNDTGDNTWRVSSDKIFPSQAHGEFDTPFAPPTGMPSSGSFGNDVVSGMAGYIADAATRSLGNRSEFRDNAFGELPNVISQSADSVLRRTIPPSPRVQASANEADVHAQATGPLSATAPRFDAQIAQINNEWSGPSLGARDDPATGADTAEGDHVVSGNSHDQTTDGAILQNIRSPIFNTDDVVDADRSVKYDNLPFLHYNIRRSIDIATSNPKNKRQHPQYT
jgi:hypothetical protein